MSRLILAVLMVIALVTSITPAETVIPGGNVSGRWNRAGSPYRIQGDITVPAGDSLVIRPGVDVIFQGHYPFYINGWLKAEGTSRDSILFTAANTSVGWCGLRFYNTPDSSRLSYFIVQYTHNDYLDLGGGIFCQQSKLILQHGLIRWNSVWSGGGIYCWQEPCMTMSHCTISDNTVGGYGGGLFIDACSPIIDDCLILNNESSYDQIETGGAGICIGGDASPTIRNTTIMGNYSYYYGGGIYCFAACTPTISGCTISRNIANEYGGGIYIEDQSNPTIENCVFSGDSAHYLGGGICAYGKCQPVITGCTFNNNSADKGGAISCCISANAWISFCVLHDNRATHNGGGIYSMICNPNIAHCTISRNSSHMGSGLFLALSAANVTNTIVEGNSGNYGVWFSVSANSSVQYCDVTNNEPGNYFDPPGQIGMIVGLNANGDPCDIYYNISADPLFEDPANGNFQLTWQNFPISDSTRSPCIDAGFPFSPPDPDSTIADIGADYFDQSGLVPVTRGELRTNRKRIVTANSAPTSLLPEFRLCTVCPNPFNSTTAISYKLQASSHVSLRVYDTAGRLVTTLVNSWRDAGLHSVTFDASGLASGIYLYKLEAGDFSAVSKMVLLK